MPAGVEVSSLTFERDRDLLVLGVAAEGGLAAIRALRSQVADDAIRAVLVRTAARGLSPRRLRFW
jgi:hypothetical protein